MLNALLQRERGQQIDVATAYFSIRGFEQVRPTLPEVRRFRLLLGDQPQEGEDIGLRPDSAAYLRHELAELQKVLSTEAQDHRKHSRRC